MKGIFEIRIIRSPYGDFYGKDIENSIKNHPDWYLEEISKEGFNAVWLHCILRDIVSCNIFPEFGKKEKQQISALNNFVEKTEKYGLKVFLYLCEPRGFREDNLFWKNHPDVKGQSCEFYGIGNLSGKYYALCSSTQKVKDYLYQSSYKLFKKVEGLGGVFMITASEFHTHCYSHYPKWRLKSADPLIEEWARKKFECKRCEKREAYEVVSEIITLINKGIKDANPKAKVIAWNWSWYIIEPDPQENLISKIPKDVIILGDFERGGYKKILGKRLEIDEYSLSYTGPSPRFKKLFYIAKKRGMKVIAKLQIGSTHELVTVPYIPVLYKIAEKLYKLKKIDADGYLGCWIFGGNISPMSKVAGKISISPFLSPVKAVKQVAIEEFGKKQAEYVIKGWKLFSYAWNFYPFSIPFLYSSPINYATAYPFKLSDKETKSIPSWLPLPRDKYGHIISGDNLKEWIKPFNSQFVVKTFKKLLSEWQKGINVLKEGEKYFKDDRYKKEIDLAIHISLLIRSTINIIKFYKLLKKYRKGQRKAKSDLKKLLSEELTIVEKEIKIIKKNNDFGYHPEANEYFITEKDLKYKINLLKKQIKKLSD
ncbi:MAG: hypothetical protein NC827_02150 [Candidatus Omnitrophica bacterium]|nr:hypothetical protein [Candidatus Omnitrophota bacterium]MCM8802099.1 hypothetical protein [Candidatus Omnitrophota bacterium]